MNDFNYKWFIAGGWAIDLFINEKTREHNDIEIGIFRDDQDKLYQYFKKWDLKKVVKHQNGYLTEPLGESEYLQMPVHEIHGYNNDSDINEIEILLNEKEGNNWIYRREQRIKREIDKVILLSSFGIPILCPEIVILYKSAHNREKDNKDFENVLNKFSENQREWLKNALMISAPEHEWINEI